MTLLSSADFVYGNTRLRARKGELIVAGASVFVCDNLSFTSERKIARMHTTHGVERYHEAMRQVTGAIAAISLDMGIHWQMSKSFAILGRALGGLAHVGEEIRRPIARGISNLIRDNLQYEPEK